MTVTINTIAQKAGVSAPVVSAVINNNFKNCRVSEIKKKKIEKLIRQLNYVPSGTARSLVNRRTNVINIIIPSVHFFSQYQNNRFIMGVQDAIEPTGYRLAFTSLKRGYKAVHALDNIIADALLLFIWGERQLEVVRELKKFKYPILTAFAKCEEKGIHNIHYDSYTPMKKLARYLLENGHRNIVYGEAFGGDYLHTLAREGITDAVKTVDGAVCTRFIQSTEDFNYDNNDQLLFTMGRNVADQWKNEAPAATTIMCSHDLIAFGVIQRLREMGVWVPEDVSVTGCDNHPLAEVQAPPLTTTAGHALDAGRKAGQVLLEILEGKHKQAVRETVSMEPVFRGSVKKLD